MNRKRIMSIICALMLVLGMTATAFATSGAVDAAEVVAGATKITRIMIDGKERPELSERPELTDAQKAEMEDMRAKADAVKAKWDALSAAEKEEVYAIAEKNIDIELELVEKYLELGIIDSAGAATMKEAISARSAQFRSDANMPIMMGFGKTGFKIDAVRGTPPTTTN